MTALTEFLFPAPAQREVGAVIQWWESRRLAYNAAVGLAGLLSIAVVCLVGALPPHPLTLELPWQAVLAFGVCANICYSCGSLLEILAGKAFGSRMLPIGPTLYRMGLTFSIGLALFPALVMPFTYAVRVLIFLSGMR